MEKEKKNILTLRYSGRKEIYMTSQYVYAAPIAQSTLSLRGQAVSCVMFTSCHGNYLFSLGS